MAGNMKKIYLDLRVISAVRDAYRHDSKTLMQFAGANTGNYAFRHGLASLVDLRDFDVLDYSGAAQSISSGQPELVLVSCANWLSTTPDYERGNGVRASVVERIKGPVVSFGLGAQAPHAGARLELGPNTVKLAHLLSERSNLLSVRDEFTANVLSDLGVKNVCVTGCPSNFISLDCNLGSRIVDRCRQRLSALSTWDGVRAHICEYSGGHAYSGRVLSVTMSILDASSSFYVLQSPALMPFLLGERNELPAEYVPNSPDHLRSIEKVSALLKRSTLHFSSVEGWLDFARTCDIAFGMRIHGNMIPLQAGVPAIVISHDSRTLGLSRFMGVPTISPEDFVESSARGPYSLVDRVVEGFRGYDRRRLELAKIMRRYLEVNGVGCTDALQVFCSGDVGTT